MNKFLEGFVELFLHALFIVIGATILSKFVVFNDLNYDTVFLMWVILLSAFKVEYSLRDKKNSLSNLIYGNKEEKINEEDEEKK